MVKCPNCGNETNDNFCGNCGTKIEKLNICPNCNSEVDAESIFCPKCGEKLKETDEKSSEEETAEEVSESDVDEESVEEVSESDVDEESVEEVSESDVDEESGDDDFESDVDEESVEEVSESDVDEESGDDDASEDVGSDSDSEKKTQKENIKYCPYCNSELESDDEFCQECGKPLNVDQSSFESVKLTIQPRNIIVFSLISIVLCVFISLILSYIFSVMGIALYPAAFFISLLVVLAVFASFKDYLNGGLVGIITGLVIGLLATFIVEYVNGFSFSYDMFSGYAPIIFTIFGAIVGIVASKFLRGSIKKFVDVESFF